VPATLGDTGDAGAADAVAVTDGAVACVDGRDGDEDLLGEVESELWVLTVSGVLGPVLICTETKYHNKRFLPFT
jgi:hypothetical protein